MPVVEELHTSIWKTTRGTKRESEKTKASLKYQLGARSDTFLSSAILYQAVIITNVKYLQPKRTLPEELPSSDRPGGFWFTIV